MRQPTMKKSSLRRLAHTLTEREAATIKGMLARGDKQHDIAARFGVNGGRIAEIATESRFADVPTATTNLPPPGPVRPLCAQDMTELSLLLDHLCGVHGADRVRRLVQTWLDEAEVGVE